MRDVTAAAGVYVNDATVSGILYELPALNPDAAAVIDAGGGDVRIPCAGHGVETGKTVRLERTLNYNGEFITKAGPADELVVTATFVAETFTGDEFIYVAVETTPIPIVFDYVAGSNGNYVGKIVYTEVLLQGESYMMCIKLVSGSEQVLAKVVHVAGFQGL